MKMRMDYQVLSEQKTQESDQSRQKMTDLHEQVQLRKSSLRTIREHEYIQILYLCFCCIVLICSGIKVFVVINLFLERVPTWFEPFLL